jgi:hypothetical protein
MYGGVYMDCKSGVAQGSSLDEFVAGECALVLRHWPGTRHRAAQVGLEGGEFLQWVVAAPPRDEACLAVIKFVADNIRREQLLPEKQRRSGKRGVITLTGPAAFTLAAVQHYKTTGAALPTGTVKHVRCY